MSSTEENQEKPASKVLQKTSPEDWLGIRLKAAREAKGLSQTELHKLTGLSRTVLINYEAGRHIPGVRELRLLCDALGVSPNFVIYGTEEPISRTEGLADSILSLGVGAVPTLMMLIPMLAAILGRDDTRTILLMIEALLKSKSAEAYVDVMKIVEASKLMANNPAMKDVNKVAQLFDDPKAQRELHDFAEHMESLRKKADKL